MRFEPKQPPRRFAVGADSAIALSDCGAMRLEPDEQITFVTERGAEYDVVRKNWGFYATPSLNGRLVDSGLRAVLVRNEAGRAYLLLVEDGHEDDFWEYMQAEQMVVIAWLHEDSLIDELEGDR